MQMDHRDFTRRRAILKQGLSGTFAIASASLSPLVFAQASWPSKQTVKIVCNFPPGGLTDSYARAYAEFFSKKFGQSFVVENRPGAGGLIGADAVAKAPADGYTFLITTSTPMWHAKVLYTKMPYQGERDFTPISLFPSGALIMGVPSSLGVKDVREFVEMSRNKPAAYGTYGAGSWPHMVINDLNERASAKVTPVHYRGETPMWVDASTGQVQAAMGSFLGINNYLGKGSIRAIAAIGNLRCPKLPQLPTFIEQGFSAPVYGLEGWIPFVAPAATPQDIVVKMAEAIQEASETPRMAAIRDAFAIPNKPTALEESRKRWKEESAVWIDIAGKLGIKLD